MITRFYKIIITISFLSFCLNISLHAQNDDVSITYHQAPDVVKDTVKRANNDEILQKIAIGGMFALQINRVIYIELAPDVSYHFNEWVAVGVGGTYIFAYDNDYKESAHVFGARTFVEGHFFNYIGLHLSYQALNFDDFNPQSLGGRVWSNNISMGGGYYRRSERFSLYAFLLYNVSDRKYNVYGNLLFRVGFNVFLK